MPVHDADGPEAEMILRGANETLLWLRGQLPREGRPRAMVERLAHALRLLYEQAPSEFRREMVKFLAANLAEMRGEDA